MHVFALQEFGMYVPVCAYTRTHSHGAVDQASQTSAGTKLGRKPMSEEEGEGKRSSVSAAQLCPRPAACCCFSST